MPRKPRNHIEGAIYHVLAGGNNREVLFATEADREKYLSLVEKYQNKYLFKLYGYSLADRQIHLLLEVGRYSLSKIMQSIQQSYTLYFNHTKSRTGHVFGQRYTARICHKDTRLLHLLRHIQHGPGEWNSHSDYLSGKSGRVHTGYIFGLFSADADFALEQYKNYMTAPQPGNEETNILDCYYRPEQKEYSLPPDNISLENLLLVISLETGIKRERLLSPGRVRKIVEARNLAMHIAIDQGIATRKELSHLFNLDPAQVSRGYYRVEEREKLHSKAIEIREKIR